MNRLFRLLRADEIDCRIGSVKENGLSLLLYKDARCDMNILDETFGAFGWQRYHSRDNANCTVSIYDDQKKEWVGKEDTGTESNTEAEKGLASDSFKRACFNWGIGRELYTAPFIWIPKESCNLETKNGKSFCYDKFRVEAIGYDDSGTINRLVIKNVNRKTDAFTFSKSERPKKNHISGADFGCENADSRMQSGKNHILCAECGCEITDPKTKDGKVLPIEDYVAMCMKFYGRPICGNCRTKNKEKNNAE